MVKNSASDLYLSTAAPISMRIHGQIKALGKDVLTAEQAHDIAYSLMDESHIMAFEKRPEMNFAISRPGLGRFRVNIFKQRNDVGMVIRHINTTIPDRESLGLPPILTSLINEKHGLILFVGATGSGKSTSLASLIDYRNQHYSGHIITIEDPIEYLHRHKKSIVNQREIGIDTKTYENALKNTLRQAPDVILLGEIRTREVMENAIRFAETGHLCLSTLHANNANQALDRILSFFPLNKRKQLMLELSINLKAIVSQRLIPSLDGKRACAVEIMIATPLVKDLIARGNIAAIKDVMEKSSHLGMQTFDSALFKHYKAKNISLEEALRNADSETNLKLKIALDKGELEGGGNLKLQEP